MKRIQPVMKSGATLKEEEEEAAAAMGVTMRRPSPSPPRSLLTSDSRKVSTVKRLLPADWRLSNVNASDTCTYAYLIEGGLDPNRFDYFSNYI